MKIEFDVVYFWLRQCCLKIYYHWYHLKYLHTYLGKLKSKYFQMPCDGLVTHPWCAPRNPPLTQWLLEIGTSSSCPRKERQIKKMDGCLQIKKRYFYSPSILIWATESQSLSEQLVTSPGAKRITSCSRNKNTGAKVEWQSLIFISSFTILLHLLASLLILFAKSLTFIVFFYFFRVRSMPTRYVYSTCFTLKMEDHRQKDWDQIIQYAHSECMSLFFLNT